MRSLLIAAAALAALPSHHADACGGYVPEPRVMMVSIHHLAQDTGPARQRSFVILDERAPEGLAWSRLAPLTFDHSKIASAPPLAEPMEVTLIGASGARTVKLRKRVYLAPSWGWKQPTAALEVELASGEDFAIALPGAARAAWLPLGAATGSDGDVAWLARNGVHVRSAEMTYVQIIRGTGLTVITAYPESAPAVSVVRHGERIIVSSTGTATAAYAHRGSTWLVTQNEDGRPRALPFAAQL